MVFCKDFSGPKVYLKAEWCGSQDTSLARRVHVLFMSGLS